MSKLQPESDKGKKDMGHQAESSGVSDIHFHAWYESSEHRFHTAHYTLEGIAHSAFDEGISYQRQQSGIHNPEAWSAYKTRVYFPNTAGGFDLANCPHPEGNARRIVACVNACAGIPTRELEAIVSGEPKGVGLLANAQDYAKCRQDKNELLAALKEAIEWNWLDDDAPPVKVINQIKQAIAKCESVQTAEKL